MTAASDPRYGCEVCGVHVLDGYVIYRTSPKGGPFRGRCEKHIGDRK